MNLNCKTQFRTVCSEHVNIQKSNSGNRSRSRHTDHSVHTTRSKKHHLLPNPNPSYSAKQNFGENSGINVRPAPKTAAVVRKILQTVMFQILCTLQFQKGVEQSNMLNFQLNKLKQLQLLISKLTASKNQILKVTSMSMNMW